MWTIWSHSSGDGDGEVGPARHDVPIPSDGGQIFDKVGVRSRRELVAELFLQQCAPRLRAGIPPGADGWFSANGDGSGARVVAVGDT